MTRASVERRLTEVADRLRTLRGDLAVADEQLQHFSEIADDTRLRALVSETPIADREFQEAERHAEAMRRHREEVRSEIDQLEERQDELLDRLLADT